MVKEVYCIIDSRGRVYLPKELRLALSLENDSLVKLAESEGNLQLRKVHLIELGDHPPKRWRRMFPPLPPLCPEKSNFTLPPARWSC